MVFAKSRGICGGLNLDTAIVKVRNNLNGTCYGRDVSPANILMKHSASNKMSAGLRVRQLLVYLRLIEPSEHRRSKKGGLILILVLEVASPSLLDFEVSPDLCSSACGHHLAAQFD